MTEEELEELLELESRKQYGLLAHEETERLELLLEKYDEENQNYQ